MKDDNFLKENNARHLWHPMGHPADSLANPPKIITGAEGVKITDIDGHSVVDAVGGLWCANLGYSNDVIKDAIAKQLYDLPYYSAFAGSTNPPAIEARSPCARCLPTMAWRGCFSPRADQMR